MNNRENKLLDSEETSSPKYSRQGKVTRERILKAAVTVFSELPYEAASIRMIGKAGGFDHSLIRYHFPTKAKLCDTAIRELSEDFIQKGLSWVSGLDKVSPAEALSLFIDRFLEYNFAHPEALKITALNSPQYTNLAPVTGHQHLPEVISRIEKAVEAIFPRFEDDKILKKSANSFNALAIFFIGSSECQAEILGMDPKSDEYKEWVRDTLLTIFQAFVDKYYPDKD